MKSQVFASVLVLAVAGCAASSPGDWNTPGYTGQTTVIGNNSTIAGDSGATRRQQITPPPEQR